MSKTAAAFCWQLHIVRLLSTIPQTVSSEANKRTAFVKERFVLIKKRTKSGQMLYQIRSPLNRCYKWLKRALSSYGEREEHEKDATMHLQISKSALKFNSAQFKAWTSCFITLPIEMYIMYTEFNFAALPVMICKTGWFCRLCQKRCKKGFVQQKSVGRSVTGSYRNRNIVNAF